MRMKTLGISIALALSATSLTSTANDDLYWGAGVTSTKYTESNEEASLSAFYGRFGKTINENFSIEGRIGLGLTGDDIYGVDLELKNYYGAYIRAGAPVTNIIFPYAIVGYSRGKLEASSGGYSASASESDTSFGLGVDFNVKDGNVINLEYMNYIDKDGSELDGFSLSFTTKF